MLKKTAILNLDVAKSIKKSKYLLIKVLLSKIRNHLESGQENTIHKIE